MSKLKSNLELLRRIDKKYYLTEREHHQFVTELKHELQRLEKQDEILSILKENARFFETLADAEVITINLQNKAHKEKFNIIKERLNNEKIKKNAK